MNEGVLFDEKYNSKNLDNIASKLRIPKITSSRKIISKQICRKKLKKKTQKSIE
jgi:hypothetical protein